MGQSEQIPTKQLSFGQGQEARLEQIARWEAQARLCPGSWVGRGLTCNFLSADERPLLSQGSGQRVQHQDAAGGRQLAKNTGLLHATRNLHARRNEVLDQQRRDRTGVKRVVLQRGWMGKASGCHSRSARWHACKRRRAARGRPRPRVAGPSRCALAPRQACWPRCCYPGPRRSLTLWAERWGIAPDRVCETSATTPRRRRGGLAAGAAGPLVRLAAATALRLAPLAACLAHSPTSFCQPARQSA